MRKPGGLRFHATIAQKIGFAILSGEYPPGSILPGEIESAEQFQVSRSVYREAIRILSAKGLVTSRPKAGTHVTSREQWNLLDPDVLAWTFDAEPPVDFIRDLFELRMIVEPAAAELAARRRSGEELSRMGHALEEMAYHGLGVVAGRDADQLFHRTLLIASHNAPLTSLSSSIEAAVSWTTIYKQRKRKLPRDPIPDHRILFNAIADADADAARAAMVELLRLALADTEVSGQEAGGS
ncbi:FadR/GntR family transcriptional regulator [Sphingomonas oryzagri]